MASYTTRPTLDLAGGREVLDLDLAAALELYDAASPEALGWRRAGPRRLLVNFKGVHKGVEDSYLLRLEFIAGRAWPPSAQFVDPDNLEYRGVIDQHYLPQLRSSEVHVHPAYKCGSLRDPIQLICCSATFEYYDTLHGGGEPLIWKETDTFLVTLNAIGRGMAQHYFGRFGRHGG
jgi:hypothetical protein